MHAIGKKGCQSLQIDVTMPKKGPIQIKHTYQGALVTSDLMSQDAGRGTFTVSFSYSLQDSTLQGPKIEPLQYTRNV